MWENKKSDNSGNKKSVRFGIFGAEKKLNLANKPRLRELDTLEVVVSSKKGI